MKKIVIISGIILTLIACNTDKKAKLEKLKKQHDKISEQIKALENELNSAGIKTDNQKIKLVTISEIQKQPFYHYIEVQGKLDGDENITVTSKTIGVVNAIYVKEGDAVKKGQVLATLDAQILYQSLEEVKTQLDFATNLYNKQKSLWDQKIGSEIQYLTAKTNKESLENRLKTLQEQINMSKITSPINGTIEEMPVKIGQSMAPGIPAFRVVNFSKVKIMADVAEAFSSKVSKGDSVLINFPDINLEIKDKIDFASKYINPINRTFTIEIKFNSGKNPLRANMVTVIKITDYSSPEAIVIPVNLVQSDNIGSFVFVSEMVNGKLVAKKRIIKQGMTYNGLAEILEGLKEGDKVISAGYQDIEDGQSIKL
jgi:membrane fusion protein (multidrug efflux system)